MVKVITYGTYDLLHYGHIRLLQRAKALGDYLIVGVTADDFDKTRGKINVQQSLMERIEGVRATGLADEIIIEEYEGQKIDDIRRYGVDIFTVGSDWEGKFDYLKEYCHVVYLDRTEGVSSSEIRAQQRKIRLGLVGEPSIVAKVARECHYVNGLEVGGVCTEGEIPGYANESYEALLEQADALYIVSEPSRHEGQIRQALERGKHVLCEPPMALSREQGEQLQALARENHCVLMDAIKTAYATAYARMLLLVKSGKIGEVVSVEATATSLKDWERIQENRETVWNSICDWGPTAMLPVFQILGTDYRQKCIVSKMLDEQFDLFTQIRFLYDQAVATVKVGKGVKSEGSLVISGTKGYIYVPAPWWKTEYFEIRYEDQNGNKRYFYQLDGEGIRYELVAFLKAIQTGKDTSYISREVSNEICNVIEDFYKKKDVVQLH